MNDYAFSITEINENEGGDNGNGAWQGDGAGDVQYGGVGQAGMQHFTMINNAQHRDTLRAVTDNLAASRDRDEFMLAKLLRLEQIILSFVNQMNRRPHLMLQAAAIDRANNAIPQNAIPQNAFPQQDAVQHYQALPLVHEAPLVPPGALPATLSPTPRSLHVLWEEWENGIGGRKPASTFTVQESGHKSSKSTYSRRKAFWSLVCHLVRRGLSSQDAINRIYGHNLTVSMILSRII